MISNLRKEEVKKNVHKSMRRLMNTDDFITFIEYIELQRDGLIVNMRNSEDSTGVEKNAGGVVALTNILDVAYNIEDILNKLELKKVTLDLKALQREARKAGNTPI